MLKQLDRWWMLPESLKHLNQWVTRGGKDNKMPINPQTHKPAEASNPATWGSFKDVRTLELIGIELAELIGIDFDHIYAYETKFCAWARDWVSRFATLTYVEFSPSGTGTHVITTGNFCLGHEDRKEIFDQNSPLVKKGTKWVRDVNALIVTPYYDTDETTVIDGRYFTMTGNLVPGSQVDVQPIPEEMLRQFYGELLAYDVPIKKVPLKRQITLRASEDDEILEHLTCAMNHAKWEQFQAGNTAGYSSASEADFACACLIAFYTTDAAQVERIMRTTGLEREKWDKHKTYLRRTIANALGSVTEHYSKESTENILRDMKDQVKRVINNE